jgi:hypothetical protein
MSSKNKTKPEKHNVIEISAEYIYFVIVGEKENLLGMIHNMEKINKDINKKFIITRLDIPILFKYNKIQKLINKNLILDLSIESAQSYAFAQEQFLLPKINKKFIENDTNINYMIMMIDDNILRFPKIELIDEDPEQMIIEWIQKYNGHIPINIKKTIKPLSLVGYDNDILVYMAKV